MNTPRTTGLGEPETYTTNSWQIAETQRKIFERENPKVRHCPFCKAEERPLSRNDRENGNILFACGTSRMNYKWNHKCGWDSFDGAKIDPL